MKISGTVFKPDTIADDVAYIQNLHPSIYPHCLHVLALMVIFLCILRQTGYENFRQRYTESQNPFDKGILSNIMEVLFKPLPPSRVDFRAEVMMPRR